MENAISLIVRGNNNVVEKVSITVLYIQNHPFTALFRLLSGVALSVVIYYDVVRPGSVGRTYETFN